MHGSNKFIYLRVFVVKKIRTRVGYFERTASKHVYYLGWNRSPAKVGCMRQVLGPGALERPRRIGWRGRWEGGSGWGTHNPWLIHVNVWQKPLQYCKVISLQLIKINEKRKKKDKKCSSQVLDLVPIFPGTQSWLLFKCVSFIYVHNLCVCVLLKQHSRCLGFSLGNLKIIIVLWRFGKH